MGLGLSLRNKDGGFRFDPRRVYFGWWIVMAGAVNGLLMVGVTQYAFGIFIKPMNEELGWSVALIASASSIRSFESGFMSPLTGYMVDKLGPRLITNMGIACMAVGLLMFALVHDLWLFFASSIVIAAGQSLAGGNAFNVAIVNWFQKKRARAIGLARSGSGAGSLTVPPLVFLVEVFGWRVALVVLAVIVFAVGLFLRYFLKAPHPSDMGLLPDGTGRIPADAWRPAGEVPQKEPGATERRGRGGARDGGEGLEVKEAVRTPAFYLMAVSSSLRSAVHTTWLVLAVHHLLEVGFAPAVVGALAGSYGLTQFLWRLVIAWAGDALGRRRVLLMSFVFQGVGMLAFASVSPERLWLVPIYFIVYGIGNAAWSTMDSTQVADYFGTRRYATLSGLKGTIAMPLGLATPIIAGHFFDVTGTYRGIFSLYAGVMACGGLCVWAIRRPLWKDLPAPVRDPAPATTGSG
jgi:MFS family permease